MERPLLALVLMLKDEARSATAIVASCRDQVDRIVLLDTGSRDETIRLVREAAGAVPVDVVEEPFVDFATSRNRSLELARATGAVFGLLLSGDETLVDPDRSLRTFCQQYRDHFGVLQGAYYVQLAYGGLRFDQARLVRLDAGWRFVGAVHEVLCKEGLPPPALRVPGVYVAHEGADPERKQQSLYQHLQLLREQQRRTPDDARTQFYLAQTLQDLGFHAEAFQAYRRRVEMGGWHEEAYEASYRSARTARLLGRPWAEAQDYYLEAHRMDPRRAEPLYEIAHYWHGRGDGTLAWLFAARGASMPYPRECVLFVQSAVYEWKLLELAAAAGLRVGEFEQGEAFARRLAAARPDAPQFAALVSLYEQRRAPALREAAPSRMLPADGPAPAASLP